MYSIQLNVVFSAQCSFWNFTGIFLHTLVNLLSNKDNTAPIYLFIASELFQNFANYPDISLFQESAHESIEKSKTQNTNDYISNPPTFPKLKDDSLCHF